MSRTALRGRHIAAMMALWGVSLPCFAAEDAGASGGAVGLPVELSAWPAEPGEQLRTPGVSTFSKGALSNIVIRGYQRENIMVVFDGAVFFGAAPIRVDAPPYHLNYVDTSAIIVTQGPYNLMYPGGAGGTVEVVGASNPAGTHGRSSLTYGTDDAFTGTAYVSTSGTIADIGGGYSYSTAHVPESGDGRLITDTPYPNPNNNYQGDEKDRTMYGKETAWIHGGITPTSHSRLELSYSFHSGEDMLTPTLPSDAPSEESHRMSVRYRLRDISASLAELSAQAWIGRSTCIIDDRLRASSDPANAALPYASFLTRPYATHMDFTADTTGGRLDARWILGGSTLRSGMDFYQRDWTGEYSWLTNAGAGWQYLDNQVMLPDTTTRNGGIYGVLEIPLSSSLRLTAGLRGDVARISANGITGSLMEYYRTYYDGHSVPKDRDFTLFSGNVQLSFVPTEGVEFFVKGGQGNRLPDGHELYISQLRQGSNLVGNPYVDAPSVLEADAGFRVASGRAGLGLTFFYSGIQDYILPVYTDPDGNGPIRPARTADNVNAIIQGAEAEGHLVLLPGLRLSGGISYTHGENRTTGKPLAEMQPLRGSVALRYGGSSFYVMLSETMAARQDRVDPLLNEKESPGFAVTNLKVGYRYKALSVTGGVNNLFDKQYYLPLAYMRDPITPSVRVAETGRNWFLSASYHF